MDGAAADDEFEPEPLPLRKPTGKAAVSEPAASGPGITGPIVVELASSKQRSPKPGTGVSLYAHNLY